MSKIQDLRALGYTVGIAQGSVQVEEDALAAAKEAADPNVVAEQANQVTADTVQTLANQGKLPETDAERLELATQIGAAALEGLTAAVTEKAAFHERALAIAKEMPDVWHVDHSVEIGDGTQRVVSVYVSCKADGTGWDEEAQAQLDALAHQPSYDERVFQAQNPDAIVAAQQLAADGKDVTREMGSDTFMVDGAAFASAAVVALADEATPAP